MRSLEVFRTRQSKRSPPPRYVTARKIILYNAEYYRKLNMEHWVIRTGKLRITRRIWYFPSDQVKTNQMGGLCPRYEGTGELHAGLRWRNVREIEHLGELFVDGRTISNWSFKKWFWEHGLCWSDSGQGRVVGACECGDEHSVSIKFREFIG